MGKIINPATGKAFVEVAPDNRMMQLRLEILRALRARYDAAQSTTQNQNHWKWADSLSPNSANSLPVRKMLRERSRYETMNNGYLKGISLSVTQDFVGKGPTLQVTDSRFTREQQQAIEKSFSKYAKHIKLRRKLWRLRMAKIMDGETFMLKLIDNQLRNKVKYDYRILECDQFSSLTPPLVLKRGQMVPEIDGVRYDPMSGRPTKYFVLNEHPGETEVWNIPSIDGQWIDARQVIHWFRQDRGWLRGIPETSPTLPLWALLRRYTLAVVQNAEIAADFTVLLKSMQPPNTNPFGLSGTPGRPTETDADSWFDSFPVDRGMMTVLPNMYEMTQLDPKQPVTMYDAFVNALIQEASRPLLTPRNLALGNSGGYNMASGSLDRQVYRRSIDDERMDSNDEVLDRCLEDWWFDSIRIESYFREEEEQFGTGSISVVALVNESLRQEPPDHCWRWDEVPEHSDPVKVATAIDILHKAGHLSDKDIQEGRFNRSVEEHYANLEEQIAWREANMPEEKLPVNKNGPIRNRVRKRLRAGSNGNGHAKL